MRKFVAIAVVFVGTAAVFSGIVRGQTKVPIDSLPFSLAREAGSTLYVSGQIAITPDGTPVKGSIADETRQTMRNIRRILADHGYSFQDVVNVNVYLSDMKHYDEMNDAYREFFPRGNFPARACVGGLQIAYGLNMEISCIAHKEPRVQPLPLTSHVTR